MARRWTGKRNDPIWQAKDQNALDKYSRLDNEAVRNSVPGAVAHSVIYDEFDWVVVSVNRIGSVLAVGYKRGYERNDCDPNPGTTSCFTHENEIDHPTRKAAESWIRHTHSGMWCEQCYEAEAGDDND